MTNFGRPLDSFSNSGVQQGQGAGVSGSASIVSSASDPTVNDDSGDGYAVGQMWVNTSTDCVFILCDATVGAAVWARLIKCNDATTVADRILVFDNVTGNAAEEPADGDTQFGLSASVVAIYGFADQTLDVGSASKGIRDLYLGREIAKYNNITTIASGVPSLVAEHNLTAQGAAISATTIYAVPEAGAGMYRVSWVATVTRAATTSSSLGGSTGFRLTYTDADDSVVKTAAPAGNTHDTSVGNTTASQVSGTVCAYCKASTNLQYAFGYTSVGATSMQYNLHIRVEPI